ncbi:MAG: AI-2E family transporter, partial [Alphaproteobacteria bacterium]
MFWIGITLAFFVFLFLIKSILLPFILGILIAYLLDPVTDKLEEKRFSRGVATSIVIGGFFSIAALLLVIMLPVIAKQLSGLIEAIPVYIQKFKQYYGEYIEQFAHTLDRIEKIGPDQIDGLSEAANQVPGFALKVGSGFVASLFSSGVAILNAASLFLITPIVAFYLLRDWDRLVEHIDNLLPRKHAATIREQMRIIDRTLAGFLRGQFNVCLILGPYYAIGLTLVGLKFG